jgi:Domain of unknown function (DUF4326)
VPRVLSVRDLPGFHERRPIIPLTAVYIGRFSRWYGLGPSAWSNPFKLKRDGSNRDQVIAQYRAWVCHQPELMARLPELRGRDLVCWCAPEPCHGDVLLQLANSV